LVALGRGVRVLESMEGNVDVDVHAKRKIVNKARKIRNLHAISINMRPWESG